MGVYFPSDFKTHTYRQYSEYTGNHTGKGYSSDTMGDGPKTNPLQRARNAAQLAQQQADIETETLGKAIADETLLSPENEWRTMTPHIEPIIDHTPMQSKKLYRLAEGRWRPPPPNTHRTEYPHTFGVHSLSARRNNRPVRPPNVSDWTPIFEEMLTQVHGHGELHMGQLSTTRRLTELFPGHTVPQEYVRAFIARCLICQKFRSAHDLLRHPPVVKTLKTDGPRRILGIDLFAMTPHDIHGHIGLQVLVDHFTKYILIYPIKDKSEESAADAIIYHRGLFGHTQTIVCDQGSDYCSKLVAALTRKLGTNIKFAIVDRHESNGVEPTNREIKRHLQTIIADLRFEGRWGEPQVISLIQHHLNNFPSSESGTTAFQMTFGNTEGPRADNLDSFATWHNDHEYIKSLDADLKAIHRASLVYQNQLVIDRTHNNPVQTFWQPGDLVFVDNLNPTNKSQARRLGPYRVLEQHTNNVHIEAMEGSTRFEDIHADRVSLFEGTEEQARQLAKLDLNQHDLIDIVAYRGNPYVRSTMEFELHFADDTYFWKTMVKDVVETQAFHDYCIIRPELRQLLMTVKECRIIQTNRRKSPIAARYKPGQVILVDVRCRAIFSIEWFNSHKNSFNPRHTYLIPFVLRALTGANNNRLRISQQSKGPHDIELYTVDGEFMESYAYDPVPENNEHGLPYPYGVYDEDTLPQMRFNAATTLAQLQEFGNPVHINTVHVLEFAQRQQYAAIDQTSYLSSAFDSPPYESPTFWLDSTHYHNRPANSFKLCIIEFRNGAEHSLAQGLTQLLTEIEHEVLVMLETNLATKAVRRFVEQFAQLTNYDDIGYCSTSANVLIACKQTKDQQVPDFAEDLVFISGLRGREAHDTNESSALTASFASVPINILAVSSKTIPAQVMEHADSLRSGGISRNRHTILITPCIQKEVQYKDQEDPYLSLKEHDFHDDYSIWLTKHLSCFSLSEPSRLKPPASALPIQSRFYAIDVLMHHRTVEYPQPRVKPYRPKRNPDRPPPPPPAV